MTQMQIARRPSAGHNSFHALSSLEKNFVRNRYIISTYIKCVPYKLIYLNHPSTYTFNIEAVYDCLSHIVLLLSYGSSLHQLP